MSIALENGKIGKSSGPRCNRHGPACIASMSKVFEKSAGDILVANHSLQDSLTSSVSTPLQTGDI